MNILVDIMTHIGDVLLCTPAFERIKEIHSGCRIIALIRPYTREVVEGNPLIDEFIEYDVKSKQRGIAKMINMIKLIRSKKIEKAYIFDGKIRGALLSKLAGIPIIVGPVRNDRHKYAARLMTEKRDISGVMHRALYYKKIVDPQCEQIGPLTMSQPTDFEQDSIEALLESINFKGEKLICLCSKGTFPLKDWPQFYFIKLIEKLYQRYKAKIVIVGAQDDKSYVDKIVSGVGNRAYNFTGKTNLRELWYLLNKADLFITVDTGAMHIGSTADTPMIAMFGCTTPKIYGPLQSQDKTVVLYKGYTCSPCSKRPSECESHNCLTDITVEEVFEVSQHLLSQAEYKQ